MKTIARSLHHKRSALTQMGLQPYHDCLGARCRRGEDPRLERERESREGQDPIILPSLTKKRKNPKKPFSLFDQAKVTREAGLSVEETKRSTETYEVKKKRLIKQRRLFIFFGGG